MRMKLIVISLFAWASLALGQSVTTTSTPTSQSLGAIVIPSGTPATTVITNTASSPVVTADPSTMSQTVLSSTPAASVSNLSSLMTTPAPGTAPIYVPLVTPTSAPEISLSLVKSTCPPSTNYPLSSGYRLAGISPSCIGVAIKMDEPYP